MNSKLNFKFIIFIILSILTLIPLYYINLHDVTYDMIMLHLLNFSTIVGAFILIVYNIVIYIDSYNDEYYCSDGVNRTFKQIKLDFYNNKKNYNFTSQHMK